MLDFGKDVVITVLLTFGLITANSIGWWRPLILVGGLPDTGCLGAKV